MLVIISTFRQKLFFMVKYKCTTVFICIECERIHSQKTIHNVPKHILPPKSISFDKCERSVLVRFLSLDLIERGASAQYDCMSPGP